MKPRQMVFLALLAVTTAPFVHASVMVFSDLDAWKAAAGSWNSDNFGSASIGGPQPSYDSPLGVTLRRSLLSENNAKSRTTTREYNGDLLISGPPYLFESSANQVFVFPGGPNPGDNIFAGAQDNYFRMDGWEEQRFTRLSDGRRKTTRNDYDDFIVRGSARVSGELEEAVFGLGFSLRGGAGPFPGALRLAFEGQVATLPLLGFAFDSFFGVMSTTPIDDFQFSVSRGRVVHNTEIYTNRPCFISPTEICLGNGSLERWFASASADISEMFVAGGRTSANPVSDNMLHAPEPSTAIGVVAGLAIFWRVRRRRDP